MIKGSGITGDGMPLLLIGLSQANWDRLHTGQPITFTLADAGLPISARVMIIGGETEDDMAADLETVLGSKITRHR